MGIGSLTGALLAARHQSHAPAPVRRRCRHGIPRSCWRYWALYAGYVLYLLVLPVVGPGLLTMTATNMFVQTTSDPKLRGRVMALYAMVMMGARRFGAPLMGWMAQEFRVAHR